MAVHVAGPTRSGQTVGEEKMTRKSPLRRLIERVHRNEDGAVSLETILIIGAIAIPILIFLLRWGWPRIRDYFNEGMDQLEEQSDSVIDNN